MNAKKMGNHLANPICKKKAAMGTLSFEDNVLYYAHSCMQGYRTTMEDVVLPPSKINGCFVTGIYDGHGTHLYAEHAATLILKELQDKLYLNSDSSEILNTVYDNVDETLQKLELPKTGGTTALTLIGQFGENNRWTLKIANAGDSRCVIGTRHGTELCQLSQEHTPEDTSECERIARSDFYVSDGRICGDLQPSRGFGDFNYKKDTKEKSAVVCSPEITTITLDPYEDSFVLLVSDGITGEMNDSQLFQYMQVKLFQRFKFQKSQSLKDITNELCDLCGGEKSKTKDNTSAVLLFFPKTLIA